jgi:hypothetical protein
MATIQDTYEEEMVDLFDSALLHCSSGCSSTVSYATRYILFTSLSTNAHSVYVGIPRFANEYINDYKFDYEGLAITNPRPTSFHVSQSKKLNMGGGFSGSGHLTAFNASIRVPDTNEEFAVFPVPQIDFNNGANLKIDQDLDLSCVECLSKLAVAAATNQSFGVLVTGDPDLKFGALPTAHLNIHKTMNMNGMFWQLLKRSEILLMLIL